MSPLKKFGALAAFYFENISYSHSKLPPRLVSNNNYASTTITTLINYFEYQTDFGSFPPSLELGMLDLTSKHLTYLTYLTFVER